MSLQKLIENNASIEDISSHLNNLSHAGRLAEVYKIKGKTQAKLYEMAEDHECSLEKDFVAPGKPALTEVIHHGINSMAMFTKFQKRMCRPNNPPEGVVAYGYNEQLMKAATGPGYFMVRLGENPNQKKQVVIDYSSALPAEKVDSWPKIIPNSSRLSYFIYNNTMDWMWKVSHHVTIGRAARSGSWLDNWFILVRED